MKPAQTNKPIKQPPPKKQTNKKNPYWTLKSNTPFPSCYSLVWIALVTIENSIDLHPSIPNLLINIQKNFVQHKGNKFAFSVQNISQKTIWNNVEP